MRHLENRNEPAGEEEPRATIVAGRQGAWGKTPDSATVCFAMRSLWRRFRQFGKLRACPICYPPSRTLVSIFATIIVGRGDHDPCPPTADSRDPVMDEEPGVPAIGTRSGAGEVRRRSIAWDYGHGRRSVRALRHSTPSWTRRCGGDVEMLNRRRNVVSRMSVEANRLGYGIGKQYGAVEALAVHARTDSGIAERRERFNDRHARPGYPPWIRWPDLLARRCSSRRGLALLAASQSQRAGPFRGLLGLWPFWRVVCQPAARGSDFAPPVKRLEVWLAGVILLRGRNGEFVASRPDSGHNPPQPLCTCFRAHL